MGEKEKGAYRETDDRETEIERTRPQRKRMVNLMKIRPPGDFPDGSVAKTLCSQCRSTQDRSLAQELGPVCYS